MLKTKKNDPRTSDIRGTMVLENVTPYGKIIFCYRFFLVISFSLAYFMSFLQFCRKNVIFEMYFSCTLTFPWTIL